MACSPSLYWKLPALALARALIDAVSKVRVRVIRKNAAPSRHEMPARCKHRSLCSDFDSSKRVLAAKSGTQFTDGQHRFENKVYASAISYFLRTKSFFLVMLMKKNEKKKRSLHAKQVQVSLCFGHDGKGFASEFSACVQREAVIAAKPSQTAVLMRLSEIKPLQQGRYEGSAC